MTLEWRLFLNSDKNIGVKTAPLRALARGSYVCHVPLKPLRKPDAFHVCFIFKKAKTIVRTEDCGKRNCFRAKNFRTRQITYGA